MWLLAVLAALVATGDAVTPEHRLLGLGEALTGQASPGDENAARFVVSGWRRADDYLHLHGGTSSLQPLWREVPRSPAVLISVTTISGDAELWVNVGGDDSDPDWPTSGRHAFSSATFGVERILVPASKTGLITVAVGTPWPTNSSFMVVAEAVHRHNHGLVANNMDVLKPESYVQDLSELAGGDYDSAGGGYDDAAAAAAAGAALTDDGAWAEDGDGDDSWLVVALKIVIEILAS